MRRKRPYEMMKKIMETTERYGWGESDRLWLCGHDHWPSKSIGYGRIYRAMRLLEMWAHVDNVYPMTAPLIEDLKSEMWDKFHNLPIELWKVSGIATKVNVEGPHAGRSVVEVRASGCNLSCEGCDRTQVDDGLMMSSSMVRKAIHSIWGGEEVLTFRGGEPLLWQENMAFLESMFDWKFMGREVHVETNGTIIPNYLIRSMTDSFIVKPKVVEVTPMWRVLFSMWEKIKPVYKLSASDEKEVEWITTKLLPGVKGERLCVVPRGRTVDEVRNSMVNIETVVKEKRLVMTPNRQIMSTIHQDKEGVFK